MLLNFLVLLPSAQHKDLRVEISRDLQNISYDDQSPSDAQEKSCVSFEKLCDHHEHEKADHCSRHCSQNYTALFQANDDTNLLAEGLYFLSFISTDQKPINSTKLPNIPPIHS